MGRAILIQKISAFDPGAAAPGDVYYDIGGNKFYLGILTERLLHHRYMVYNLGCVLPGHHSKNQPIILAYSSSTNELYYMP